jgi:hypothetical protein
MSREKNSERDLRSVEYRNTHRSSPSLVAIVPWNGVLDAAPIPAHLDEADRARDRVRRIILQAEGQRQIAQHLGVGLALDLGIQRFVSREH